MRTIQERYENWRLAVPQAFITFEKLANQARDAGFEKYSARTICEVMRWYYDIERVGQYKLNNTFIKSMAKELVEKDPSFEGFFEFRSYSGGEP